MLLGPQDLATERMVAERRLIDQVLGDHRGLIVGPGDLLDDYAALALELLGVQTGPADEVREKVDRLGRRFGAGGDVEGDDVVAGVGVQLGAEPLGRLVDVAVGGVLLATLEYQMLEEVGHTVLLGALGASASVKRHQGGDGAGPRKRDAVKGQAVGQLLALDGGHRATLAAAQSWLGSRAAGAGAGVEGAAQVSVWESVLVPPASVEVPELPSPLGRGEESPPRRSRSGSPAEVPQIGRAHV